MATGAYRGLYDNGAPGWVPSAPVAMQLTLWRLRSRLFGADEWMHVDVVCRDHSSSVVICLEADIMRASPEASDGDWNWEK